MPEPISLISSAVLLLGEIGKSVLVSKGDKYFCDSLKSIYKKFNSSIEEPTNHDILKSIRKAQLKSTILACKHVYIKKYKIWNNFFSNAPENLREVISYLKVELKKVELNEFQLYKSIEKDELTFMLKAGTASEKSRLNEFNLQQKLAIIDELESAKLNWIEKSLKDVILKGWKNDGIKVDWYRLMCSFFVEELKTNSKLSNAIYTNYMIEIKDNNNKTLFALEEFKDSINSLRFKNDTIVNQLNLVLNSLDELKLDFKKIVKNANRKIQQNIIQHIKKDGDETRNLVRKVEKSFLKNAQKNKFAIHTGKLNDFFSGLSENNHLHIEVAVKEGGTAVLFYDKTLKVHLKRIEYFVTEKDFVFCTAENDRRSIGLPLNDKVSKHLINANEIILIRLNSQSTVLSELKIDFKAYK